MESATVNRKRKADGRTRKPLSVTIDEELLNWIKEEYNRDRTQYRSISHVVEVALQFYRKYKTQIE